MNSPAEQNPADQPVQEHVEKPFFAVIVHSFFIIPFLIAVFCVLLFTAVTLLTREQQTVYDFLSDIKVGGETKRWQAAFELSKILVNPKLVPQEDRFVHEMISAYQHAEHDHALVRQYLALAMGRSGKQEFFEPLVKNINTEKEENLYTIIYALGMLRDARAVPVLIPFVKHENARLRSAAVVALGNINDPRAKEILKKALNDPEPNVQWGSAISLASMNDASGLEVILKLLNREYLGKFPEVDREEQNNLVLAAIESAQILRDPQFDSVIEKLAHSDQNMNVRSAAMKYLQK